MATAAPQGNEGDQEEPATVKTASAISEGVFGHSLTVKEKEITGALVHYAVGTSAGANNWASGFLPSTYQGVTFRSSGDPVLYLSNPKGVTRERQRAAGW